MSRPLAPCGTPSAYRRHLRRWEHPCRPCRAAHAAYERARKAGGPVPPRELTPCGTGAAWKRHMRRGEQPCPACVLAHRAEVAASYRRRGVA